MSCVLGIIAKNYILCKAFRQYSVIVTNSLPAVYDLVNAIFYRWICFTPFITCRYNWLRPIHKQSCFSVEPPWQWWWPALLHQNILGSFTTSKYLVSMLNMKMYPHKTYLEWLILCFHVFQQTLNMTLDHKCQIFQNLNGAVGEKSKKLNQYLSNILNSII